MNREKKYKLIVVFGLLLLATLFLIVELIYGLAALVFFSLLIILLTIFLIIELYIRVQHNIDGIQHNIEGIQHNIDEKFSFISEITQKEFYMISNLFERFPNLEAFFDLFIKEKSKQALCVIAPDLFKHKTVLYIGANQLRSYFLEDFKAVGYKITLLEIFKKNVEYYKSLGWIEEIIHKDVKDFKTHKKYDVVFWWHGPEHIEKNEIKKTLKNLEKITKKIIVLGCPLGNTQQGCAYGNKFEKHLSSYETGYFENLGYKTHYIGRRNNLFSTITAVKYIR